MVKRIVDRHHAVYTLGPLFEVGKSHHRAKVMPHKRNFPNSHFFKEAFDEVCLPIKGITQRVVHGIAKTKEVERIGAEGCGGDLHGVDPITP